MTQQKRTLVAATLAAFLFMVAPARAAPDDDATTRNYVLTSDKAKRFATYMTTLKRDGAQDAALRAELSHQSANNDTPLRESMKTKPVMLGYARRAGLTEQDACFIPIVIMYAGMAVEMPPAQRKTSLVSPASLEYVRQHKAELTALMKSLQ